VVLVNVAVITYKTAWHHNPEDHNLHIRLEFGWQAYMVLLELPAAYGFIVIFFSLFKRMPG
jgi:hypothetical protein